MKANKGCRNRLEPALSGFVLIFGIVLLNYHKKFFDEFVDEVVVFKQNNYFFKQWKDPPSTLPLEFYFFNWTNPEDLFNASVKPKFQEIGPIVLIEEIHKWNITFNANNTITHRNKKVFILDAEKSKAKLEDNITSVNVVPMFASEKSRNWNFFYRKGLSIATRDTPYHLKHTIRKWLFEGYEDPFLKTASYLPFLDDLPNLDKVAWFYKRNNSELYEGVFNIGTGNGNTTIGKTYRWNYKNRTEFSGYCGEFQAPSELFPQNIKKDKIEFFSPDLCRKTIFYYNGTISWYGLEAYKFVGDEDFVDNENDDNIVPTCEKTDDWNLIWEDSSSSETLQGKYNKKNTCFCNRKCLKYGVTDYSKCSFGMPSYVSLPHFTKADSKYRTDIDGMSPDGRKHKLEIVLVPRTGTLLAMQLGIQVNMYLEKNPSISKFKEVPEFMIPILWFYADYQIDLKNLIIVHLLIRVEAGLRIISYILILSGAALYIRIFYHYLNRKETEKHENLTHSPENLKLITDKTSHDKC